MIEHTTSSRRPRPAVARAGVLQRRCACGGITGPGGECAACRARRLQSEAGTRSFVQTRFEHDFSRVRVYTDGRAAASVNAVEPVAHTELAEREADAAAHAVAVGARAVVALHAPPGAVQRQPATASATTPGMVSLCNRDFAGRLGTAVPARHCFVWFHPPGTTQTPATIDPRQTSTYDNSTSGTPDAEPNKPGTVCPATYQVDPDCVLRRYRELCPPARYNLATFNCCSCAYEALTACGATPSTADLPAENQGTGLPDSFGRGWKKRLLEGIDESIGATEELGRDFLQFTDESEFIRWAGDTITRGGAAQAHCVDTCEQQPWYARGFCLQGCTGVGR